MQTCFILTAATGELEDYQIKNISVSLDKAKLEVLLEELTNKDALIKEQQIAFGDFMDALYEQNKTPIMPQLEYPEFMTFDGKNGDLERFKYLYYYEDATQNSRNLHREWEIKIETSRTNWLKENNIPEDILGIDPDVEYNIEEISLI